jgi:diguanylate cyclase (GGDEF)-like protein/PAS domain S-box-containing protein
MNPPVALLRDPIAEAEEPSLVPFPLREAREPQGQAELECLGCRQARTARNEIEDRYALVSRGANDGLWDWDLEHGAVLYSPRWKALLGFADVEIGSDPSEWFGRVHPDDIKRVWTDLRLHLDGVLDCFQSEFRIRHRDGTYRWVFSRGLARRDSSGNVVRIAGSLTDVSAHKRMEKRLEHSALYDPLTELPNRALFLDRLGQCVVRARLDRSCTFAVLLIDVNRLQKVNDALGHKAGGRLLVEIARRIQTILSPNDTLARLESGQFGLHLDAVKEASHAVRVAERIHKAIEEPFALEEQRLYVTVSIGIAWSGEAEARAEDLLREANIAMRRAKSVGAGGTAVFDLSMQVQGMRMLELEAELRAGIERGEFVLHYQPIVSLVSGQIAGCEALLRWQHPKRGLVSPGEFIPLAEETGLIVPLSEWALREACSQLKAWQDAGLPRIQVAVNLSAIHFRTRGLSSRIQGLLQEVGLAPQDLKIELTESAVMENLGQASTTLRELQSLGVQIALDDFGTGYSSLSYLYRFRVDTLKIDRSFVADLITNPDAASIATVIIGLAHTLHRNVVAEGVETPEQLEYLRQHGCDEMQGYLFSRPVPAPQFAQLLRDGRTLPLGAPAIQTGRPVGV